VWCFNIAIIMIIVIMLTAPDLEQLHLNNQNFLLNFYQIDIFHTAVYSDITCKSDITRNVYKNVGRFIL
jgi:hypothetical protein